MFFIVGNVVQYCSVGSLLDSSRYVYQRKIIPRGIVKRVLAFL